MIKNIEKVDYKEVVDIFNEFGKNKAAEFVKEKYGVSYQSFQRNIYKNTGYFYSRNSKKYELEENNGYNFLTLEELCNQGKENAKVDEKIPESPLSESLSDSFKEIMVSMMKDRIQEFSKYIFIEQSSKIITIDTKKLEKNGYTVMLV